MKISIKALTKLKNNSISLITNKTDIKNEFVLIYSNDSISDSFENPNTSSKIEINHIICDIIFCDEDIKTSDLNKIASSVLTIEINLFSQFMKKSGINFLEKINNHFFDMQKTFVDLDKALTNVRINNENKEKEINLLRLLKQNNETSIQTFNDNIIGNKTSEFPKNFDVFLPFQLEKLCALDIYLGSKNSKDVIISFKSLDYGELICSWTFSLKTNPRWIHLILPKTLGPDVLRGVLNFDCKSNILIGPHIKFPYSTEVKIPIRSYSGLKKSDNSSIIKNQREIFNLSKYSINPKNAGEINLQKNYLNISTSKSKARAHIILTNERSSIFKGFRLFSENEHVITIEYLNKKKWELFAQDVKIDAGKEISINKTFEKKVAFKEIRISSRLNFSNLKILDIIYDWNSFTQSYEPKDFNPNFGINFSPSLKSPELVGINNLKDFSKLPLVSLLCPINNLDDFDNLITQLNKQIYPNIEFLIGLNGDISQKNFKNYIDKIQKNNLFWFDLNNSQNLGDVLNQLTKKSHGDYLFKIDADDYYGKKYVFEAISTSINLNYNLISKRSCFLYLDQTNETFIRTPKYQKSEQQIGFGGTICAHRSLFENYEITFRHDTKYGTDLAFFLDCEARGIKNYSTSFYNYTYVRKDFENKSHTWQTTRKHLIKDSIFIGDKSKVDLFES